MIIQSGAQNFDITCSISASPTSSDCDWKIGNCDQVIHHFINYTQNELMTFSVI